MKTDFTQYQNVAAMLATLNHTPLAAYLLGTLDGATKKACWQRVKIQQTPKISIIKES